MLKKFLFVFAAMSALTACGRTGLKDLSGTTQKENPIVQNQQTNPTLPHWQVEGEKVCKVVNLLARNMKDPKVFDVFRYLGDTYVSNSVGEVVVSKTDTEVCLRYYTYNQWFMTYSRLAVTKTAADLPGSGGPPNRTRQALYLHHSSDKFQGFSSLYPHLRVADYLPPHDRVETWSQFCVPRQTPELVGVEDKVVFDLWVSAVKCCGGDWELWDTWANVDGKRLPGDSEHTYLEVDLTQCQ